MEYLEEPNTLEVLEVEHGAEVIEHHINYFKNITLPEE